MELELEVSAPGHRTERILYTIRGRENRVLVTLEKLPEEALIQDIHLPPDVPGP